MANETKQKAPRRYERMRDSGVEWIGMVPEEWAIFMVGQLATQVKNKNIALQETNLLSLSYGKIKRKNISTTEGLLPASFDNYNIIEAGDVILRLTDLQNDHTSLRVGLATEKGIITSAYLTIRPQRAVWPNFLYYALHAFDIRKGFYGMGAGVRQGLKFDEIRQIRVIVPALKIQKSIVSYLEKKCDAIDEIITEAKASIEEYKAWKSSIIYEAVTKGLNPTAEMKDSGVKWIGEMPKAWTLQRAKRHVMIMHGMDPKTEGDIPVYGSGAESFKTCGEYKIGPAVLLGRKGATLNIPHYIEGRYWNVDTAFDAKTDSELNLKYYYYLATCFDYKYYISQTTLPGMTQTSYNNMLIPIPPLQEQRNIVSFVDEKCRKVDDLIVEKKSLISDLESYKKSLIYEVVTGKRRVC